MQRLNVNRPFSHSFKRIFNAANLNTFKTFIRPEMTFTDIFNQSTHNWVNQGISIWPKKVKNLPNLVILTTSNTIYLFHPMTRCFFLFYLSSIWPHKKTPKIFSWSSSSSSRSTILHMWTVWPDVEIKNSPIFSQVLLKSGEISFSFKGDVFRNSPSFATHLDYF